MTARVRLFRFLAKFAVNPAMRRAISLGIAPNSVALVETTGRLSGEPRQTPVLNGLQGDAFWLFAEHGHNADYVRNLLADPRVRIRANGQWRTGTAFVLAETDLTRRRAIERRYGVMGWLDGLMFRAAASDPIAIRIDLDH